MDINFSNKQRQVLVALSDPEIQTVAFSGSMAGRSLLGIYWIIQECINVPDSRTVVARRSFRDLQLVTAIQINDLLMQMGASADFCRQDMYFRFPKNGSVIILKSLEKLNSDPDYLRMSASIYSHAFVDEAQEIEEAAINMLQGRLYWEQQKTLYSKISESRGKMLLSVVPTDNWVKKRFYDRRLRGTSDELIVSSIWEHQEDDFQEKYVAAMRKVDHPEMRRLMFGDWNYNK